MILLIAHHKGGVGKSTIAINLAVEFQRPNCVTSLSGVYRDTTTKVLL